MTPEDRHILEQAFSEAVELAGNARETYLNRFRDRHGPLVDELRDLLAADADDGQFLAGAVAASVTALTQTLDDPWIGRTLGAWKITRRLGSGGMGAVFLVERVDGQFRQTAALKLMSARLLSSEALSRFRTERQILANLKHPNIAGLIDGGATDADLPYLVMEYVDGDHIDHYCDSNRLTIDARLELFLRVCDAVDHAHRHLVVHRDLKPGNILIDTTGTPKLLDFGIAKLLASDSSDTRPALTRDDGRVLTPEFASPEQVRGEPVSVATDVYALGVLLFRLLTGQSPYGAATTDPRELESAILEREPSRPSALQTNSMDTLSARRCVSSDELSRLLADELDNIVLMCLQKDPSRRYPSVRELSADLQRFLSNQPVMARGNDWVYRSRKFIERNVKVLIASSAAALLVVTLVVVYTLQLTAERNRAQVASLQSQRIAEFLIGVFESADPAVAKGEELSARELLARGVAEIDTVEAPLVRAELQRVMGVSLTELGDFETAGTLLEQSVALLRSQPDAEPLALARSLSDLGEVYSQRQTHADAIALRREALRVAEAALGPDHEVIPLLLARLGRSLNGAVQVDEALSTWQQALEVQRRQGTYGDGLTSDILGGMATAYDNSGNYTEAMRLLQEALPMSETHLGRLDPNTVIMVSNLGLVYGRLGDFENCTRWLREAIERARKLWPPEHPRLMFYLNNYAIALQYLGKLDEAQAAFDEVETFERNRDSGEGIGLINLLYASSGMHTSRGDYARAYAQYAEAHALSQRLLGEDSELALITGIGMGTSLFSLGRYEETATILRSVLQHETHLRRSHILQARLTLGDALSRLGDDSAGALLADVVAQKRSDVGADSPGMREFLRVAAAHFRRRGDFQRALEFAEALYRLDAADGLEYGRVLAGLNRSREALPVLRAAHAELIQAYGASDPRVLEVADAIARLD